MGQNFDIFIKMVNCDKQPIFFSWSVSLVLLSIDRCSIFDSWNDNSLGDWGKTGSRNSDPQMFECP